MEDWEITIEAKIVIKPRSSRDKILEDLTSLLEALTSKLESERPK